MQELHMNDMQTIEASGLTSNLQGRKPKRGQTKADGQTGESGEAAAEFDDTQTTDKSNG